MFFVVAGIIVPVVLYFASQTERELVYAVNPIRTTVVTAGQATELAVVHRGEPLGDIDITAAQVAIWNAGEQSIRQENVLQDIVIFTVPSVPILEASIRERSRDVSGFRLVATPESLAFGIVPVSWRILEENDGASVQLIYQGTQEVEVRVQGVIEGVRGVKEAKLGVKIKTPEEQVREQQRNRWIFGIMALVYGCIPILAVVLTFTTPPERRRLWLALAISSVIPFAIFIWQYFFVTAGLWPPFGF